MKNYFKINLLLAVLLFAVLLFPLSASALTITGIVVNIGVVIGNVAVAIIIIFWIITGLLFLSAQGDPTKLTTARKALIAAIAGTAIAILAASASSIISSAISGGV